jgi:hypothetical protein
VGFPQKAMKGRFIKCLVKSEINSFFIALKMNGRGSSLLYKRELSFSIVLFTGYSAIACGLSQRLGQQHIISPTIRSNLLTKKQKGIRP